MRDVTLVSPLERKRRKEEDLEEAKERLGKKGKEKKGRLGTYIDADFEVFKIIEGVEDSEDIDPVVDGFVAKLLNDVVRISRVANCIGTADEHLKRNVRNRLPQQF